MMSNDIFQLNSFVLMFLVQLSLLEISSPIRAKTDLEPQKTASGKIDFCIAWKSTVTPWWSSETLVWSISLHELAHFTINQYFQACLWSLQSRGVIFVRQNRHQSALKSVKMGPLESRFCRMKLPSPHLQSSTSLALVVWSEIMAVCLTKSVHNAFCTHRLIIACHRRVFLNYFRLHL